MERRSSNVGHVDKLGTSRERDCPTPGGGKPPAATLTSPSKAGLAGQSPAGETFNAPAKVYKIGASLGLSALGSIAGMNCSFTIDTAPLHG